MFEAPSAPPPSLCCLETFGENANKQTTEGLRDCMNSYTNTAATTAPKISVVKWLLMRTTDILMTALISFMQSNDTLNNLNIKV